LRYLMRKTNGMAKTGPIILIEDDSDDQEIVEGIFKELGTINRRIFFANTAEAFTYLKTITEQPFLILCDVNLPLKNGLEFKRQINADEELRAKCIPFVFLSTAADKKTVSKAYEDMMVQGFFKKEDSLTALKKSLSLIIEYWTVCKHPNSDE
jgi:CheY-like chemotaxis protein